MRGEKVHHTVFHKFELGSPPLARGKELHFTHRSTWFRITPACAGKSVEIAFIYPVRRDHPRLRGEKTLQTAGVLIVVGSPPLARGKVCADDGPSRFHGITPACAGKRTGMKNRGVKRGDHPRLRGEKHAIILPSLGVEGSPPLARGKVTCISRNFLTDRITPACAGKR